MSARPSRVVPLEFASAVAVACTVFVLAYGLFRLTQPWIVAGVNPVNLADFTPWARWAAAEQDGAEVAVALPGLVLSLGACVVLVLRGVGRSLFSAWPNRFVCFAGAAAIVINIRSTELSLHASNSWWLAAAALLLGLCIWWIDAAWPVQLASFCVLACVLLLTARDPSLNDYGFVIGPSLKWLQGEALGTFYMQYSLLLTLVMAALLKLRLHINQIQFAFAVMSLLWLALYWWLACAVIADRKLRTVFVVCLVAFRILWLQGHIAQLPQVTPFRMELWLPLALVAQKKGVLSPWTAAAFALGYALDAMFGLMYLAAFLAAAAVEIASLPERRAHTAMKVAIPALLAALFNLIAFGSLVAQSATLYVNVKLGFLPIATDSLFWLVFFVLLFSSAMFARADSRFGLLLVLMAAAQATYFLGRSHDHNLINIGGLWLLVFFSALDASPIRAARVAAWSFMFAVMTLGAGRIVGKLDVAFKQATHGPLLVEHPFDEFLTRSADAWPKPSERTAVLSSDDAYLNYRLGLHQVGFYCPFSAHVMMEETTRWIYDTATHGDRVLVAMHDPTLRNARALLAELNRTHFVSERGLLFSAAPSASSLYYELTAYPKAR